MLDDEVLNCVNILLSCTRKQIEYAFHIACQVHCIFPCMFFRFMTAVLTSVLRVSLFRRRHGEDSEYR